MTKDNISTCSYSWEEWDKKIKDFVIKNCKEKSLKNSDYCIFHDPNPDKDLNFFNKKIEEQCKRKDFNFIGYHFPRKWRFVNEKFEEYTDFRSAKFYDVNFYGNIFHKGTTFKLVNFFGKVNFRHAYFHGQSNFKGSKFFGDADFSEATFNYVDFVEATFCKNANFKGSKFFGDADFSEATFNYVDFVEATFCKNANFKGSKFFGDADFNGTTFQNLIMNRTVFKENLELIPNKINELDLRYSKVFFMGTIKTDLKMTKFYGSFIKNVSFMIQEWPKKIYEEKNMNESGIKLSYKELETIYRNLKQNMQDHGNYPQAGEFYYREMECKKESMREKIFSLNWFKSLWYSFLKYSCGYGERPFRTIISSFGIIFIWALLYWILRCLEYSVSNPTISKQIKESLYFSFVTFTTLGLGDILPLNDLGRAFICAEALLGAFFMALFVVVFVRKMAR